MGRFEMDSSGSNQCEVLVNVVINIWFNKNSGKFLMS
jgi:hypothetical protein